MIQKICKLCGSSFEYPEDEERIEIKGTIMVRYPICPTCMILTKDTIIKECNMKPIKK